MKKVCLLLAVALFLPLTLTAHGDEDEEDSWGFYDRGYGGPVLTGTPLVDSWGILVGGAGAWPIGAGFAVGGGGYTLMSNVESGLVGANGEPLNLRMGYGGLLVQYRHPITDGISFSVGSLFGGGGMEGEKGKDPENRLDDGFFVIEPELTLEARVTSFARIGVGASYRQMFNVDPIPAEDLGGPAGHLSLIFGNF